LTPPATPLEGGSIPNVSTSNNAPVPVPGKFSLSSHTIPSNLDRTTAIDIVIPRNTDIAVKIYNANGQEIATIVNQYLSAGKYNYTWSANGFARGIYFVKLVAKNYATAADRMVVLQ
jgi:flagellar hook assembly protein FlgD